MALLLSVLVGGCGRAPRGAAHTQKGGDSFPSLTYEDTSVRPFAEIHYQRPDVEALVERLQELTAAVADCETPRDLKPVFEEGEEIYWEYDTMYTFASLMYSMDMTSAHWEEERAYIARNEPALKSAYWDFYGALYASPFREGMEEHWIPGFFDAYSEDESWYPEGTEALYIRESDLASEYMRKFVSSTISWEGQEISYYDIYAMGDYDKSMAALEQWYTMHEETLGGIYVELVRTRMELAERMGFDSYAEMALDQWQTDYSPEMIEALLEEIITYLSPIYRHSRADQIEVEQDYEAWTAFVGETLAAMDVDLAANFQMMQEYELIDWEPRPGKEPGAFTTYFSQYWTPYMMMSYEGDAYSMLALIHEFGHMNDYMVMGSPPASADVAETFSQGLELLVGNHFHELFGPEAGEQLLNYALFDKLSALVLQGYFTAIELEVYGLEPEEVSLSAVEEVALQQARRFGVDFLGAETELYAYDWVTASQMFETPFYPIAYATSADLVLQLWELSLTDEQAAIDAYWDLLLREESLEFIANAEAAGFSSPFQEGEIRRISEILGTYLLEDEGGAAAA